MKFICIVLSIIGLLNAPIAYAIYKDRYEESEKNLMLRAKCHPTIYPYLIEPKEYPEYPRRPYHTLSWEDFNYETQFVAGRNLPLNEAEIADVSGRVYRPNLSLMRDLNFMRKLQFSGRKDFFLHNIGGYGPGSPFPTTGGFGEYIVPSWQIEEIKKIIGKRFTGFDVGEQDGRFNFTYHTIIEPYIPDRKRQYLLSQPYFDRIAADLGNWCSALSVLWYWHPIIKEGYTILAGAETQNKITNGQVQYMHLRGAGKQYGVLWYGDVSVFDSWGYKEYNKQHNYNQVNNGGSLSLMKRSYYTQYMYNSTILSMEHGWCDGQWGKNKGELSPIGIMHNDCANFVKQYGQPGVMITQIALLNDFYSGWMPASHILSSFRVWNGMPYEAGDYLTDNLISMLYPYYERSGFFHNETGAMCATPYGENADVLLSDARIETMRQYPIMVAAGDLFSGGKELSDKIKEYVRKGGIFVTTSENANRIWPEWAIASAKEVVPVGSCIQVGGKEFIEDGIFNRYSAKLPQDARTIAQWGDKPMAVDIPLGKGQVILSLTGYGLNETPFKVKEASKWHRNGFDTYLERPYRLLKHFEYILGELFESAELFSVGKELGYIVNFVDKNKYRIAIYNNTLKSIPFTIKSKIGKILSIKELSTGNKLFHSPGYWPNNIQGEFDGKDDDKHIYGGDIRLFDVEIEKAKIEIMERIPQSAPVKNTYLASDNMMYLKEDIRNMPTFFNYFDGIAVNGKNLLMMDNAALKRQNEWYKLQSLNIAADLRQGFNDGYWTLNPKKDNYQQTMIDIENIARKLNILYGKQLMIVPITCKEHYPVELKKKYNICFADIQEENSNWILADKNRILDCASREWEQIYMAMTNKISLNKSTKNIDKTVLPINRNHILYLDRYVTDINKAISEIDCFYDAFSGVCINAEYLSNKCLDALLEEKRRWDKAGLSVVVSFIEEINHFPGLTLCDAVPAYYEKSIEYYKDVLNKMGHLGLKRALFTTQPPVEANYTEQQVYEGMKKTFSLLTDYAKKFNIKILLTNTRFRVAGTVEQQNRMINEINNEGNLKLAINLNHLTAKEYMQAIEKAGNLVDVIILGGVGSSEHAAYLPIAESGKSADWLNKLDDVLLIEKVYPINNRTVCEDCKYMGWLSADY